MKAQLSRAAPACPSERRERAFPCHLEYFAVDFFFIIYFFAPSQRQEMYHGCRSRGPSVAQTADPKAQEEPAEQFSDLSEQLKTVAHN